MKNAVIARPQLKRGRDDRNLSCRSRHFIVLVLYRHFIVLVLYRHFIVLAGSWMSSKVKVMDHSLFFHGLHSMYTTGVFRLKKVKK